MIKIFHKILFFTIYLLIFKSFIINTQGEDKINNEINILPKDTIDFIYSILPTEYKSPSQDPSNTKTPELVIYETLIDLYYISQVDSLKKQKFTIPTWNFQSSQTIELMDAFDKLADESSLKSKKPNIDHINLIIDEGNEFHAKIVLLTYYSLIPYEYKNSNSNFSEKVAALFNYILDMDSLKHLGKTSDQQGTNWSKTIKNPIDQLDINEKDLSGNMSLLNQLISSEHWYNHLMLSPRISNTDDSATKEKNKSFYDYFKNYLNTKQEGIGNLWSQAYINHKNRGIPPSFDDIKTGLSLLEGDHIAEYALIEKFIELENSKISIDSKILIQQLLLNTVNPTIALRGAKYVFKNDDGVNYTFLQSNITELNSQSDEDVDITRPDLVVQLGNVGQLVVGEQENEDGIIETWIQFKANWLQALIQDSPNFKEYWENNIKEFEEIGPIGSSVFIDANNSNLNCSLWISDLFALAQDVYNQSENNDTE